MGENCDDSSFLDNHPTKNPPRANIFATSKASSHILI